MSVGKGTALEENMLFCVFSLSTEHLLDELSGFVGLGV